MRALLVIGVVFAATGCDCEEEVAHEAPLGETPQPPAPDCTIGRADCDGNARNGCETQLGSDRSHCGSCQVACAPGIECGDGECRGRAPAELVGGAEFTCARTDDGGVSCFGSDRQGQLGDDDEGGEGPVRVEGLSGVVELTAGASHACARLASGDVYCWGDNDHGQLGDGTTEDRHAPVQVEGLGEVAQLAAGAAHTCARSAQGSVQCWGRGETGALGAGGREDRSSPARVFGFGDAVQVDAREDLTCALTDTGDVACWGAEVGFTPGEIPGAVEALELVVTNNAVCYRTVRDVWCSDGSSRPTAVEIGPTQLLWSVGPTLCAQLMDRSTICGGEPAPHYGDGIPMGSAGNHRCVRRREGDTACWGDNGSGQLGDGTTTDRVAPVTVEIPERESQ